MDSVAEQRAFSDKFRLPFPLLSDPEGRICDAYRVVHPWSRPRRETFLFRHGVLVHHDRAVNPARQAEDLLLKMRELSVGERGR
jgi:peroxiredoxin Q/BCP